MDAATAPGTVAQRFAARRRAWEEDHLSPLAARSYPARRTTPEEDCALRTPLQRDRDRIVHCKAFRRLKHKTQVFVAPEGDHYRTRMTHTLEVTQIARTVARALALNEDLTEAIGLGHDLGHPPFGHIGEAVLDSCLRERFATGFRHYEHSLRIVEVLERGGAGLNLCADVRDGILCHSGRAPQPRDARGPHRADRRPRRLHQPRHRRRPARRRAGRGRAAGGGDRRARARRARRGSTRSCTTSSSTPSVPATSSRARRPGRRWTSCATFMFDHVYLGEAARAGALPHRACHPHAVRALRLRPRAPPGPWRGARRRSRAAGHRLHRGHDRSLRRPRVHPAERARVVRPVARDGPLHQRLQGARARRGRHGRSRVARARSCAGPGSTVSPACVRFTTSARRRSGSTRSRRSTTASAARPAATRSRSSWRPRALDFKGALELLADRYEVALELEDEDPQAAEQRRRRERLLELLERTATFYVRRLWESRRGRAGARLPRPARPGGGDAARVSRRLRAQRMGHGAQRLPACRLRQPRALRRRPRAALREVRAHLRPLPLADHLPARRRARPHPRLRGTHARRRGRPAPEVRQQPGVETSSTSAASSSRPTSRGRRRRRPAASSSPRATPTSSRCTRSGCATASASWAPR